jgi:hypothetical protein
MLVTPGVTGVQILPTIEATAVTVEVKVTGRPEEAVATKAKDPIDRALDCATLVASVKDRLVLEAINEAAE